MTAQPPPPPGQAVPLCQASGKHNLTDAPLVTLPLGHALEHSGHLSQQVSAPASELP